MDRNGLHASVQQVLPAMLTLGDVIVIDHNANKIAHVCAGADCTTALVIDAD